MNNHLKQHFGYWLYRVRSEIGIAFENRLLKHCVTVSMWNVLISIYDKQCSSVSEIATYIEIDIASVSRTVEKLVQKGLLIRKSGKNRRTGLICLTKDGEELIPALIKEAEENEKHFFGNLN